MTVLIVIPSRFQSVTFPGKPLAMIRGKSVVRRTYDIAVSSARLCSLGEPRVLVATDDERVADHVREFGGDAITTSASCPNGTVRTYEAVREFATKDDIIVNLEGNFVLTPPWVVASIINSFGADPLIRIATPMVRLTQAGYRLAVEARRAGESAGTFVVRAKSGDALYFSRAIIPAMRGPREPLPVYLHVALYAYRFGALCDYVALPPSELEEVEGLEQLRALENNMPIRVVEVDYRGRTHCTVETDEDIKRIEAIIEREGELSDFGAG